MLTIGVRNLKQRLSEVLRRVRDSGEIVEITNRGETIARLVPVRQPKETDDDLAAIWTTLDQLAAEISAEWPEGVSAVEAVSEGRREL
jgi:prevent-host-death family protein